MWDGEGEVQWVPIEASMHWAALRAHCAWHHRHFAAIGHMATWSCAQRRPSEDSSQWTSAAGSRRARPLKSRPKSGRGRFSIDRERRPRRRPPWMRAVAIAPMRAVKLAACKLQLALASWSRGSPLPRTSTIADPFLFIYWQAWVPRVSEGPHARAA